MTICQTDKGRKGTELVRGIVCCNLSNVEINERILLIQEGKVVSIRMTKRPETSRTGPTITEMSVKETSVVVVSTPRVPTVSSPR